MPNTARITVAASGRFLLLRNPNLRPLLLERGVVLVVEGVDFVLRRVGVCAAAGADGVHERRARRAVAVAAIVARLWAADVARPAAALGGAHAAQALGEGFFALQAGAAAGGDGIGIRHRLVVVRLAALEGFFRRGRAFEESRGAQAVALLAVDLLRAVVGVDVLLGGDVGGVGFAGVAVVLEALVAAAVEAVEVQAAVEGAGAAHGHVGGALGEGLHGCSAVFFCVAVRVAGVEGAVVVEYCGIALVSTLNVSERWIDLRPSP